MPFTFAHPAAVIPVQRAMRRRAILSALVIGSMAPDFQNFLPLGVERADSHSLAGMFWFSLPVGMAVYLAFHLLLKKPMCALLPLPVAARLAPLHEGPALPPANGAMVVLSLLIGILTHLAWDALTHYSFVTVNILPFLSAHLLSVGGYPVYPYRLLQHASTVFGALLLWHWGRQWLQRAPAHLPGPSLSRRQRHAAVGILLAVPPLAGCGRAAHSWAHAYGPAIFNDILREAVITAISVFGVLLVAYSVAHHYLSWHVDQAQTARTKPASLPQRMTSPAEKNRHKPNMPQK